jgi:hypothetical protein
MTASPQEETLEALFETADVGLVLLDGGGASSPSDLLVRSSRTRQTQHFILPAGKRLVRCRPSADARRSRPSGGEPVVACVGTPHRTTINPVIIVP